MWPSGLKEQLQGIEHMARRARRRIRIIIRDFSLALCCSSLVMLAMPADEAAAGFTVWEIVSGEFQGKTPSSTDLRVQGLNDIRPSVPQALYRNTNRTQAVTILAIVISLLAAFNMWILRHLRRVHASNKRAARRATPAGFR
jgi:hypothetical protein